MDTNLKTKTGHYRDLGTVIVAQLHDIVFIHVYRQFDLVRSINQNLVFLVIFKQQ